MFQLFISSLHQKKTKKNKKRERFYTRFYNENQNTVEVYRLPHLCIHVHMK